MIAACPSIDLFRMMSLGVLLKFFALAVGVFTLSPNMRGVQIKNVGTMGVWLVMTGEESFLIPPGQIVRITNILYIIICYI